MLYYRIMVLNFQFVQIFHEQKWFLKSVRNMTQICPKLALGLEFWKKQSKYRYCPKLGAATLISDTEAF
jgi:hypothetical protein